MTHADAEPLHGYRRADGRVGVRNHVLVLSPTGLTSAAATRIASLVRGTVCVTIGLRPRPGRRRRAAAVRHAGRPRHAIRTSPRRWCCPPAPTSPRATSTRSPRPASRSSGMSLPDVHEDALALVDAGVRAATRLVRDASMLRREPCALAELCVAVECGHSDATSGLVCNPLAGRMMELVVAAGGQAMFSETVEWTGAEHLLARRAVDGDVAERIVQRGRRPRADGARLGRRHPRTESRSAEQGRRHHDDRGEGARRDRQGWRAADPGLAAAPPSARPGPASS